MKNQESATASTIPTPPDVAQPPLVVFPSCGTLLFASIGTPTSASSARMSSPKSVEPGEGAGSAFFRTTHPLVGPTLLSGIAPRSSADDKPCLTRSSRSTSPFPAGPPSPSSHSPFLTISGSSAFPDPFARSTLHRNFPPLPILILQIFLRLGRIGRLHRRPIP